MKKLIGIFTALVMLTSLGQFALAETSCSTMILEGIVLDVSETGGYLLDTKTDGEVMILINEDTVFEGQQSLVAGDFVFVTYNGVMTRSLPPQVNAMQMNSHVIAGVVSSLDTEGGSLLLQSEESGVVMIRLPDMETLPREGDYVRVYFNGVMALSYPGQVNGMKIDIFHKLQGEVRYVEESFFLMGSENGTVQVNLGQESELPEGLTTGSEVTVYYKGMMTRSLPPQVFGVVVTSAAE